MNALTTWAAAQAMMGNPINWNSYPIAALLRPKNKELIQFFIETGWRPSGAEFHDLQWNNRELAYWLINVVPNLKLRDYGDRLSDLLQLYQAAPNKPAPESFYEGMADDFYTKQYASMQRDNSEFPYFKRIASEILKPDKAVKNPDIPKALAGRLDLVMDWMLELPNPNQVRYDGYGSSYYSDWKALQPFLAFLKKNNCPDVIAQVVRKMILGGTLPRYEDIVPYAPDILNTLLEMTHEDKHHPHSRTSLEAGIKALCVWRKCLRDISFTAWIQLFGEYCSHEILDAFAEVYPKLSLSQLQQLHKQRMDDYLRRTKYNYSYVEAKEVLSNIALNSNPWGFQDSSYAPVRHKISLSREFKLAVFKQVHESAYNSSLPFTRTIPQMFRNCSAKGAADLLTEYHPRKLKLDSFYSSVTQQVLQNPETFACWRKVLRILNTPKARKHELVLKSLW